MKAVRTRRIPGLLLALALVACSPAAAPSRSSELGTPAVITTGLAAPWSIVFLSGGTPVISQRDQGEILELDDAGRPRVIGTVAGVEHTGESGLLGLAVDDQDRLYAYSTGSDGNRIQRFRLTGEPGSLALGEPESIIEGLPSASHHDAIAPIGDVSVVTSSAVS